jgi:hypothetical protein
MLRLLEGKALEGYASITVNQNLENQTGELPVVKFMMIAGATLAMVTAASAADLPRPQPVPQQPPVLGIGKMPIGKSPIGKAPIGKAPAPVSARY